MMAVFGTVGAVWAVSRWPGQLKEIIIAIAGAVISSYSFTNGLLTWVIIVPLLMISEHRWRNLVIWTCAATAAVCLYLYGYVLPANHQPLTRFAEAPWQFILYILYYTGCIFDFGSTTAVAVAGFVMIAVIVASIFILIRRGRESLSEAMPWLGLAAYVIPGAFVTGIGRLGLGAQQAISSRYATFAMLLALAVIVITVKSASGQTNGKPILLRQYVILTVLLAAMGAFYILSSGYSLKAMKQRHEYMQAARSGLMIFPNTPERFLLLLHDDAELIRDRAQRLKNIGLLPEDSKETR